jgi:hypothetical protein
MSVLKEKAIKASKLYEKFIQSIYSLDDSLIEEQRNIDKMLHTNDTERSCSTCRRQRDRACGIALGCQNYSHWLPIEPERSCEKCELRHGCNNYSLGGRTTPCNKFQPKPPKAEQGGDDLSQVLAERDAFQHQNTELRQRLAGMQNEHGRVIKSSLDMMQMNISLTARLAECEKERDHYKDFCGSQRFASDFQNADQMREALEEARKENAELKTMWDALITWDGMPEKVLDKAAEIKRKAKVKRSLKAQTDAIELMKKERK